VREYIGEMWQRCSANERFSQEPGNFRRGTGAHDMNKDVEEIMQELGGVRGRVRGIKPES